MYLSLLMTTRKSNVIVLLLCGGPCQPACAASPRIESQCGTRRCALWSHSGSLPQAPVCRRASPVPHTHRPASHAYNAPPLSRPPHRIDDLRGDTVSRDVTGQPRTDTRPTRVAEFCGTGRAAPSSLDGSCVAAVITLRLGLADDQLPTANSRASRTFCVKPVW